MKRKPKTTTGALSPSAGFPGKDKVFVNRHSGIQLVTYGSEYYLVFYGLSGDRTQSYPYYDVKGWVEGGLLPMNMSQDDKDWIKAIIADFDKKITSSKLSQNRKSKK